MATALRLTDQSNTPTASSEMILGPIEVLLDVDGGNFLSWGGRVKAEERTVSQVLTEQIRYQIPAYQRPYSWERENVEQLLDDVWQAFERTEPEYFIGSLITIEIEEDVLYDVVDGQQRLTTLNLILARLRDHVSEPAKSALGKRVLPKNELTGEEEKPRLTLRKKDQSFFRDHVLAAKPLPADRLEQLQKERDSPKLRIVENLGAIDSFCASKDESTLKMFANYLLTKVYVVFVTTTSLQSAYRLFNVLNARGMALSNADLIKNSLFAALNGSDSNELEERWLELEEIIGIDRLDAFLSHHRTSLVAAKARGTLHEEFGPIIESASGGAFGFLDEATASARNYLRIISGEFDDPKARRALRSLQRVKFEEWVPPLLAFLNSNVEGMPLAEFASLLEKITYQNWVRRLAFTARQTVYFQIIKLIRSEAADRAGSIRATIRGAADNGEFLQLIDGDIYTRPFALAVLLRLEEADQDESVTKSYGNQITIEHVLPQALKDDYWVQRFTPETHTNWLHRLGNLALLSGTKNYKAQYYDFDRKKAIYAEKNATVSFDTTKEILGLPEWSLDALQSRQRQFRERASYLWGID